MSDPASTMTYLSDRLTSWRDGPKVDVAHVLNELGGCTVISESVTDPIMVTIAEPEDFTIRLLPLQSARRKRFHTARGIGAYCKEVLERDVRHTYVPRKVSHERDVEYNIFAAQFLMPSEWFISEYEKTADPIAVADVFDVSPAAVKARARALDLYAA